MSKKPIIFFCDDKVRETENFKERHGKEFEVETIDNFNKFMERLRELIREQKIPDIIITNLSYLKDNYQYKREELEAEGKRLREEIERVNNYLECFYNPGGIKLLEEVRKLKECQNIPFAIYTRLGWLLHAGNDELKKVEENNGEWMRKGEDKMYEESRLHQMLRARNNMLAIKRYTKTTKNMLWIFAGVTLLLALPYAYFTNQDILMVGATIAALLLGVMPLVIEQRIKKEITNL
ncbi:MAG: hypothetical protein LBU70_07165 [Chitinispirillales bacterium]|jgi:hypothetical protein|nr:hypothetical protein [Chitinispirillales bacterium]